MWQYAPCNCRAQMTVMDLRFLLCISQQLKAPLESKLGWNVVLARVCILNCFRIFVNEPIKVYTRNSPPFESLQHSSQSQLEKKGGPISEQLNKTASRFRSSALLNVQDLSGPQIMAPDRVESIDGPVKTVPMNVEEHASYSFQEPYASIRGASVPRIFCEME